jgi:hypothetical protein
MRVRIEFSRYGKTKIHGLIHDARQIQKPLGLPSAVAVLHHKSVFGVCPGVAEEVSLAKLN